MLSSKANAALARLKEIEEKYKMKRDEWNRQKDTDSISSVSIIPSENLSAESKKSSRKLKLDIKIPDMRFKRREEETKLLSESKKSTPDKMSPELLIEDVDEADQADLDVTIPSKDKSPRFAGKQESLISDVTSIQENSSIESVLDDSMISSKSLSRSKTSRGNSSTASDKSSRREEKTRTTAKFEKGRESDKSSEISRGKASSGNSSIAKQSRLLEKSNEKTLKVRSGPRSRERSIEEKAVVKIPKATIDRNSNRSRSLRDDSVIEESIGTVDNGSEIISELSRVKTSITAKTNDSIKNSVAENASETVPSQLAIESGYANDTFEDVSSSTMRSQSQRESMIDEKKKIDSPGSSVKKIGTALLEQYKHHQNNKNNRDVIEPMASKPNATEVNLDPSNYANDLESKETSDNVNVRLIKSPNFPSSKKRYRQHIIHQPESFRTNVSNATIFHETISDSSKSLTGVGDVMKTDEKKNSPEIRMTSVRQESGQEDRGKLNKIRERAMINITGPPAANEEDIIKSNSSEEIKTEKENIFEESSGQRISQDAEEVLRKLHKDAFDALVKRYASSRNAEKALEKSSESKTESDIKDIMKTRQENENRRSSEENKMYDCNDRKSSSQKKKKSKVTNSKSAQARNTGSRKEDKTLRFDEKQMRGLRKRIVELRLQQEREDLQKYLQELKNSRLESDSTQSYFSPLEFPRIAEFKLPDAIDLESKLDDQHVVLRERVSAIRRCLKDQYILYRDYCTMAQAINAHYVPTTLQDAKKTIRELRKMTIKNR